MPIQQSKINELNISGSASNSVGMLRGQLEWPVSLQGPDQKKLDSLIPAAVDAAAAGKLNPKLMKEVRTTMKDMRQKMRDQLQKDEIETSSYLRCIEFYNALESSVNALDARMPANSLTPGRRVPATCRNSLTT